jgi:hypothetical protein
VASPCRYRPGRCRLPLAALPGGSQRGGVGTSNPCVAPNRIGLHPDAHHLAPPGLYRTGVPPQELGRACTPIRVVLFIYAARASLGIPAPYAPLHRWPWPVGQHQYPHRRPAVRGVTWRQSPAATRRPGIPRRARDSHISALYVRPWPRVPVLRHGWGLPHPVRTGFVTPVVLRGGHGRCPADPSDPRARVERATFRFAGPPTLTSLAGVLHGALSTELPRGGAVCFNRDPRRGTTHGVR